MSPLPDTQEGEGKHHTHTAHRHKMLTLAMHDNTHLSAHWWKVATIRDTHYKHSLCVYVHKRLHTRMLGRSQSVNAWASFVQIIIEMKGEWLNVEWGEKLEENSAWYQTKAMAAMPFLCIKQWHKKAIWKLYLKLISSSVWATSFENQYQNEVYK